MDQTLDYITITTLTDLADWVEPRLGADGSRAVAQRMAEELASYDDRPEWGADWSAWLREICQDGRFDEEREAAESGPEAVAENVYPA